MPKEEELSEEDAALKEKLDLLVEQVKTGTDEARLSGIEALGAEIRQGGLVVLSMGYSWNEAVTMRTSVL